MLFIGPFTTNSYLEEAWRKAHLFKTMSIRFYTTLCTCINPETSHSLFIIQHCADETGFPHFPRDSQPVQNPSVWIKDVWRSFAFLSWERLWEIRSKQAKTEGYICDRMQKWTTLKSRVVSQGRWVIYAPAWTAQLSCQLSQRLGINELLGWINMDTQEYEIPFELMVFGASTG